MTEYFSLRPLRRFMMRVRSVMTSPKPASMSTVRFISLQYSAIDCHARSCGTSPQEVGRVSLLLRNWDSIASQATWAVESCVEMEAARSFVMVPEIHDLTTQSMHCQSGKEGAG